MPKRKPQQKWNKANIWDVVTSSPYATARALERLYSFQTPDEQVAGVTEEDNGMGFNGVDAEFLTSLVVQHQTYPRPNSERKTCLTDTQIEFARKKLKKYCGQLAKYANSQEPNNGYPDDQRSDG